MFCFCLKHNYHLWYDINKFKNDINVGGQNYVAHANAGLVEVYCKQYVDREMFSFDMQCWNTEHAQN